MVWNGPGGTDGHGDVRRLGELKQKKVKQPEWMTGVSGSMDIEGDGPSESVRDGLVDRWDTWESVMVKGVCSRSGRMRETSTVTSDGQSREVPSSRIGYKHIRIIL